MRQQSPTMGLVAIIDDEIALQEALASLVRSAGFAVECYPSAEAFLASGCGARAACIVLDVSLPGMSGLDLQRHLALAGCEIPIVFITSSDDEGGAMRNRALNEGALAFLHKPFGAHDLIGAVGLGTYTKVQ